MEDYVLLHNRAKLIKKYRQNKNLWPDGIDHVGNRWYGDWANWSDEKVELWSSVRWLEDRLTERGSGRVLVTLKGVTRELDSVTKKRNVTQESVTVTQPSVTSVTQDIITVADKKRQQARARMARLRARKLKADADRSE